MATIFSLSEDLQISIIDRATERSSFYESWTLQKCSMVCKLWRRLIWNRLDWPHLRLYLSTEELGLEQQDANELFLTWFNPKWDGLKSLIVQSSYSERSPSNPTFTVKEMAKLLPLATQLKSISICKDEVLAEETTFKWFLNAHELRRVHLTGAADGMDKYLQNLPLHVEKASFYFLALPTCGLASCRNLPTTLKSLHLYSRSSSLRGEDFLGLASLTNLEDLSIGGATLYELPAWLPKLPALQTLSLGCFVGAPYNHPTQTTRPLRIKALAHLKHIESLVFWGSLPQDIGALENLKGLELYTDAQEIDLGVLQPCGSKLHNIRIWPPRNAGQVETTIKGLGSLSGLRSFQSLWDSGVHPCHATVDLQVGASNIKIFQVSCEGRFLFTGDKDAIDHLCRKIKYLRLSFLQSEDDYNSETDAADQVMLAAERTGQKAKIADVKSDSTYGPRPRNGYRRRQVVIGNLSCNMS